MVKKIIHLACLVALISSLLASVFTVTPAFASSAWFTGYGTWYWICPENVYTVKVEVWGAGGSGANSMVSSQANGGSGGGGAYSRLNAYSVTPGGNYTVVVGRGGIAISTGGTWGNDGGDSYFGSPSVCLAKGGKRGQVASFPYTNNPSGLGGQASEGVGDIKYSGGTAPNGLYHQAVGGGGAAGDSENGHNGGYNAGGVSGYEGGGYGGDGAVYANGYHGTTGGAPGGGAGGGGYGAHVLTDGAPGSVKLTFEYEEPVDPQCVALTLDIATLEVLFPGTYIGITDATLWGQVLYDGNESCQGFFEWGLVGGTDNEYTPEDSELYTGNYSSYHLDGLEASTEYWFSFNLYNSETNDTGGYSTFITKSNDIETMAYGSHSITDTTAHLQGEVLQIGNYTSWTCGRFYYTDGVISAWTPCQGGMYNLLIVEHAIGNLTPDTDYTWWFLVQTDAGYDYSDPMTFHTLDRTTNTIPKVVTNVAELSQWYVDGAWTFGFKFKGYLHDDGGLPCTYGFEYRGNGTSEEWIPYDLGRRAYQGQEFWAYKFGFTRGVVIEYRATCLNTAGRGYGDSRVIELPAVGPVPTVVPTPGPGIELPPWLQFPFSISSTIKTILGVIITVILMVLIVAMIRSSGGTVAAVAAGLGLTLVFIVIGWYPLWIGLLIGAIVGLLIFLMLMRGK
jgi:hypothetical protein